MLLVKVINMHKISIIIFLKRKVFGSFGKKCFTYYYLLIRCKGRTMKYYARGFEVGTELVRSVRKKRGLSISQYYTSNLVNK